MYDDKALDEHGDYFTKNQLRAKLNITFLQFMAAPRRYILQNEQRPIHQATRNSLLTNRKEKANVS